MENTENNKVEVAEAPKVESSTIPDDGTPNSKSNTTSDHKDNFMNPKDGGKDNFRRSGKFGNRNENKKFTSARRNEDLEQGGGRGLHENSFGREQAGYRDYMGPKDFGVNRQDPAAWTSVDYYREKLFEIAGPTHELPPLDMREKKFNGRNRLYVGNIQPDMTEEEIRNMFSKYGEITDIFLNHDKYFAFVIFDYHSNAERAVQELDGTAVANDRQIKIRFSPRASTIRVTNLPPSVTNELLYHGFSVFGEIERAIVLMDERGRSTGTGEIDFMRKKSAAAAVKECSEGCFFLTNSLRPCMAEFYEPILGSAGYSEKSIQWRNGDFLKDREGGPWLAKPNSYEFEFGQKWKQVRELYKQKEEALRKELLIEEDKMYTQMGFVKFEYETYLLKKQLEERELFWQQQKLELEKKERIADELRLRNEEDMRRREEQIKARLARQDEELKLMQRDSSIFNQQDRVDIRHFQDGTSEGWEGHNREGYWQRDPQLPADDAVSQGSRSRNNLLEEPGQVWKRLDEEGIGTGREELFHRRPEERPIDGNYSEQSKWKRSWSDEYHYGKRNRY